MHHLSNAQEDKKGYNVNRGYLKVYTKEAKIVQYKTHYLRGSNDQKAFYKRYCGDSLMDSV